MKILLMLSLGMLLSACSEFKTLSKAELLSRATAGLDPDAKIEFQIKESAGVSDEDCVDKSIYDACIIWKNAVAQDGRVLSKQFTPDENIVNYSFYGVKINELTSPTKLQHNSFEVVNSFGSDLNINSVGVSDMERYKAENVAQVMAYYWGQRTIEVLEVRTGVNYLKSAGIKVYVNENINGWAPSLDRIHLGKTSEGSPMALNGEVISYYFGLANISKATEGAIDDLSSTDKHKDCQLQEGLTTFNGCCTTAKGCSKALASGLAEYQAALVFPESPIFGEGLVNSLKGQERCALSRNFFELMDEYAEDVFEACAESAKGDVYIMGSHLAAKLWQLRQDLDESHQKHILDKLILSSFEELTANDDFETYFEILLDLDEKQNNGLLSNKLEEIAEDQSWF